MLSIPLAVAMSELINSSFVKYFAMIYANLYLNIEIRREPSKEYVLKADVTVSRMWVI